MKIDINKHGVHPKKMHSYFDFLRLSRNFLMDGYVILIEEG